MPTAISYGTLKTDGVTLTSSNSIASILDNGVTLAKMVHGTQGGILYYGAGGAPTELAAGTANKILTTHGAAADPTWETSAAGGDVVKVAETVVAGAAVASVTINGLDLATDKLYEVFIYVVHADNSQQGFYTFCNADTTNTNYYRQMIQAIGAAVTSSLANNAETGTLRATDNTMYTGQFMQPTGQHPVGILLTTCGEEDGIEFQNIAWVHNSTTNLTSFTWITHDASSHIEVGSKFIIYKRGA